MCAMHMKVVRKLLQFCIIMELLKAAVLKFNVINKFDTRQWPEVSDFVARVCTLRGSNNTRPCVNRTLFASDSRMAVCCFACDSRMAVCCLTLATCKNV